MEPVDLQEFYLLSTLLILAIILTLNNRYFFIKIKPTYLVTKFLHCQITIIIWLITLVFEILSPNDLFKSIFSIFKMVMFCYFSYNTNALLLYITGNRKNNKQLILFWISFLVFISIIYCRYLDYSFYIIIVILYMLQIGIFSIVALVKCFRRNHLKYLSYKVFIYTFMIFAYTIQFLDIINIHNIVLFNLFSLFCLIILIIVPNSNMFDDLPVVYEGILRNAHYGIIVVDNGLKILTYNHNFFERFIHKEETDNFVDLINKLKAVTDNRLSVDNILTSVNEAAYNHIIGEIVISLGDSKIYLYYTVNAIFDAKYEKIATMVSFMNISDLKYLQQSIEVKNKQLSEANIKLKEHMENLSALTSENERNKLMLEINDTIGHYMTEILGLLEVCSLLLQQNNNKQAEKLIIDTVNRARIALEEIRQMVSQYKKGAYIDD